MSSIGELTTVELVHFLFHNHSILGLPLSTPQVVGNLTVYSPPLEKLILLNLSVGAHLFVLVSLCLILMIDAM